MDQGEETKTYFKSHKILVKNNYPIHQVLGKPDLAGRMVSWATKLSGYDILFLPRGSIKSQVLADFFIDFSSATRETPPNILTMSVDGLSNLKGGGARIVLQRPGDLLIKKSLRFEFQVSINQAEYDALIAGMTLAK